MDPNLLAQLISGLILAVISYFAGHKGLGMPKAPPTVPLNGVIPSPVSPSTPSAHPLLDQLRQVAEDLVKQAMQDALNRLRSIPTPIPSETPKPLP